MTKQDLARWKRWVAPWVGRAGVLVRLRIGMYVPAHESATSRPSPFRSAARLRAPGSGADGTGVRGGITADPRRGAACIVSHGVSGALGDDQVSGARAAPLRMAPSADLRHFGFGRNFLSFADPAASWNFVVLCLVHRGLPVEREICAVPVLWAGASGRGAGFPARRRGRRQRTHFAGGATRGGNFFGGREFRVFG